MRVGYVSVDPVLYGCVVQMGGVQYAAPHAPLGGFRALKKTPEAPYTTKVNYREPTSRGTTRRRFFCCNEESGNQIILGERAVRKVAHEGGCVFFTHKSYEVYDIRSYRCLHSHSARPPPHLAHGPSTSLAGLQPIERRVTPPSQPLSDHGPSDAAGPAN